MKKAFLNRALLALTVAAVAFTACSKDDDSGNGSGNGGNTNPPPVKKNELVYDGTAVDVKSALMLDYGVYGGFNAYNFDLFITTGSLEINPTSLRFEGEGDLLYIELFTNKQDGLEDGSYTFSAIDFGKPNTFETADYVIGFKSSDGSIVDALEGSGGGITSKFANGTYEITIDLQLTNGKKLEGYFKGVIPKIEPRIEDPNVDKILPSALRDFR
jgi:hypothetical protein